MDLPHSLQTALSSELAPLAPKALAAHAGALSRRYRADDQPTSSYVQTSDDVAAYAAYRLPATYAAIRSALAAVDNAVPGWQPATMLDVGGGPGTALWAVADAWPNLRAATLVERDPRMIAFGQRLARHAPASTVRDATWCCADALSSWEVEPCDVVIAAYVLGELPPSRHDALVERLWRQTSPTGVVVIVEPGTPRGFASIRQARHHAISIGATVASPCPHDRACPMPEGDWCHFAQRVTRTPLHRGVKGVERGYEDEKFSYVAASRLPRRPIAGRVIRHPQTRKGHVMLELCAPEGLRRRTVSRKEGPAYRQARDLRWGSALYAEHEGEE